MLERALRQRLEQRSGSRPRRGGSDRIRESDRSLQPGAPHQLDGLVDGGVPGRLHEAELVGPEPQRGPNRRVQLAHRPASELLDRVVEGAHALDRPVGEPLCKCSVALVEARDRGS